MIMVQRFYPGDDLSSAFWIRDQVFTVEQKFSPEIEIDDKDPTAHHIVIQKSGKAIATARTFPKSMDSQKPVDDDCYLIGRVCILKENRKDGLGLMLMEETEKFALELGAKRFELGAQCTAAGFYERCGYVRTEEVYFEEYCQHVTMVKEASLR